MTAAPDYPGPDFAAPLRAVDRVHAGRNENGGTDITARTTVRADEPHMAGHFPGFPVFPGIFLLEAFGQAVDAALRAPGAARLELRSIRSTRFLAPAFPGDDLDLHLVATPAGGGWSVRAKARRGVTVLAELRAEYTNTEVLPPVCAAPPGAAPSGAAPPQPASAGVLEHAAVRALLPQRHPLLLVDRVLDMRPGVSITAVKAVSANEPCYAGLTDDAGHTGYAYPPSLLIESLGQAAALAWLNAESARPGSGGAGVGAGHVLVFAGARDYHFESPAYPGDVLVHTVRLEKVVADTVFATGETHAGDRRIARVGSLMAARRPRAALNLATAVAAGVPQPNGGAST